MGMALLLELSSSSPGTRARCSVFSQPSSSVTQPHSKLSSVPCSPRFGSKARQGASLAHPPPRCWGLMGRRYINPLSLKACLDCSSPVLPVLWRHVGDPHVQTLPVTDTGVVLPMAGDKCVPPGRIPFDPMAAGGREHRCSACAAWRSSSAIWFLLPEGLRHHWDPLEH